MIWFVEKEERKKERKEGRKKGKNIFYRGRQQQQKQQ
ncbi:uncharacterized protein ARB_07042 [Trichophyton benhamiae CBS 112371]|uniref:Uncharacterized protein n=1 Tax=Arthroderma benhamiae (strain ATCC MYA-4681 / CBS 112371) TaxID=663331 RepID=D4AS27_ARTBC|nr:uncharacterized protein ARB_07042 [Trichophyton benhamiae CBS 112371]EFE34091.1 hypothetical protein ARB_07042 [Trichophyton benhamiae CBS 112371]